ncbi:MAG: polysaccharide deacetylase family protein [Treponema sp.]|jgi:peptidoglycan/xylan/chitin deacetylase (PgdA/CDA1 family)|nr:polysaccharide deacetylase family protein [Treponema sp.]
MKTFQVLLLPLILLTLEGCQSLVRTAGELALPKGTVIFSFDDGPNARDDTTDRLMEVLRKYEIRALFALLGKNAEHNPKLVQRIRAEGHVIINHGYSDRFAVFMDEKAFSGNLLRGEAAICNALGGEPDQRLYRPQGGFYTKKQERIWRNAGYTLLPGTVRIYDAILSARDKKRAIAAILRKIEKQGGGIILLHDGRDSHTRMETALAWNPRGVFNRSWIPEMVEETIIALEERGYNLRGVDILSINVSFNP